MLPDIFLPVGEILLEHDVDGKEFPELFIGGSVQQIVQCGFYRIEALLLRMLIDEEVQRALAKAACVAGGDVESADAKPLDSVRRECVRNQVSCRNHHCDTFYGRVLCKELADFLAVSNSTDVLIRVFLSLSLYIFPMLIFLCFFHLFYPE